MEILIAGKKLTAEMSKCMSCKEGPGCKLDKFMGSLDTASKITDIAALANKAGLSRGVAYGRATAQGIERHEVYSCDNISTHLELAGINIITSVEK